MKDRARLIDIAKNCTIVILLISAVFLLFKVVVNEPGAGFSGLSALFGGSSVTDPINLPDSEGSDHAADPVFLLVTTEDGSHYAAKYNSQDKDKIISQFSAYLGEALGSSGALNEVSIMKWQKTLRSSGVFFDYLYPQPLSAIATWLGTEITGEASYKTARRLFLGGDGEKLVLYFISEGDGNIYSCETALDFSSLAPKIAEFPMGTANFAFELGEEYESLDPYFIFSHESEALRSVTATNPLYDDFDSPKILGLFGMNSRVVSEYTESDGSVVYVDGEKSLRIEASGKVIFSVSDKNGVLITNDSEDLTITECISACHSIVKNSIGLTSGDGVLGLINVTGASHPSSCSINFGYFADGIPVILPGGSYAASFQISGGTIVKAELYYREYTFSGSTVLALPETQAIVIAKSKGGEPVLTYEDRDDGMICTWIIN